MESDQSDDEVGEFKAKIVGDWSGYEMASVFPLPSHPRLTKVYRLLSTTDEMGRTKGQIANPIS